MPTVAATVVPFTLGDLKGPEVADVTSEQVLHRAPKWVAEYFISHVNAIQTLNDCLIMPFQQFYRYHEPRRVILVGGKATSDGDNAPYAFMMTGHDDCRNVRDEVELARLLTEEEGDGRIMLYPLQLLKEIKVIEIINKPETADKPTLPLYKISPLQLHKTLN